MPVRSEAAGVGDDRVAAQPVHEPGALIRHEEMADGRMNVIEVPVMARDLVWPFARQQIRSIY